MKYPAVGIQRKQHGYFVRELGNLPIASSSCDALAVLKDWMLNHIMGTDRQCVALRSCRDPCRRHRWLKPRPAASRPSPLSGPFSSYGGSSAGRIH